MVTSYIKAEAVEPDIIGTSTDAVYLNNASPVSGTVHFKKVHVKGKIHIEELNSQSFPSGYLLLKESQALPGTLNVNQLVMNGNISFLPGALINGIDLEAECANTWMVILVKIHYVKFFNSLV